MERNVVSLEIARKLREAGFPQETAMRWSPPNRADLKWHVSQYAGLRPRQAVSAPTAQEIADQLPAYLTGPRESSVIRPLVLYPFGNGRQWFAVYDHKFSQYRTEADGDTMADVLALLWLKLNEGKKDV